MMRAEPKSVIIARCSELTRMFNYAGVDISRYGIDRPLPSSLISSHRDKLVAAEREGIQLRMLRLESGTG